MQQSKTSIFRCTRITMNERSTTRGLIYLHLNKVIFIILTNGLLWLLLLLDLPRLHSLEFESKLKEMSNDMVNLEFWQLKNDAIKAIHFFMTGFSLTVLLWLVPWGHFSTASLIVMFSVLNMFCNDILFTSVLENILISKQS